MKRIPWQSLSTRTGFITLLKGGFITRMHRVDCHRLLRGAMTLDGLQVAIQSQASMGFWGPGLGPACYASGCEKRLREHCSTGNHTPLLRVLSLSARQPHNTSRSEKITSELLVSQSRLQCLHTIKVKGHEFPENGF